VQKNRGVQVPGGPRTQLRDKGEDPKLTCIKKGTKKPRGKDQEGYESRDFFAMRREEVSPTFSEGEAHLKLQ